MIIDKGQKTVMIIKTWRDPYDAGFSPTRPKEIELHPGLTVLVGCNGAGKTTLIQNIKSHCKENKIPCHLFDNLKDGGSSLWGALISGYAEFGEDDRNLGMSLFMSSEGETIRGALNRQTRFYKNFLENGFVNNRDYKLRNVFAEEAEAITSKKRVFLFDAADSGLSIDNVCDLKEIFKTILEASDGLETYIIISANEYELCRGEDCFDVNLGKYRRFSGYESYRRFILKSRERKEKRIDKQIEWIEKERKKEEEKYNRLLEESKAKVWKIKDKVKGRELSFSEKHRISELERMPMDYVLRECRYFSVKK